MRKTNTVSLILIAFFLASCAPKLTQYVDPEFKPFVNQFLKDAVTYSSPVLFVDSSIIFDANQPATELGYCNNSTNTIGINPSFWYNFNTNDTYRRLVLYHELGHCALWRNHNPNVDSQGRPVSIMYPYGDVVYNAVSNSDTTYYDNLLVELFNPANFGK